MFRGILDSSKKVVSHIFLRIVNRRRRRRGGGVKIGSDACENPICAHTLGGINDLLSDGNEVDDERLPSIENKLIPTCNTDRPVYKEGWKWSGIYHRRAADCLRNTSKLDGMNEEYISVLT